MSEVRIIEIKESVFADNDRYADELRSRLRADKVFLMLRRQGKVLMHLVQMILILRSWRMLAILYVLQSLIQELLLMS